MYSSAPGVESITVSLETESATVNYDPSVTDPDTLAGESDWWIVSSITNRSVPPSEDS